LTVQWSLDLNVYDKVSVLKEDINFFNNKRFHESLEYKKPMIVYYDSLKINDKNFNKQIENVA